MIWKASLIILIFSFVMFSGPCIAVNQYSKDLADLYSNNPTAFVVGVYLGFGIWLVNEMHNEGWITYSWERDPDIEYANPIQQRWHNNQKEKGFIWWNPHSWCFEGDD